MFKLLPVVIAVAIGIAMYRFSAWRTAKQLDANSAELAEPEIRRLTKLMAGALDLPRVKVHVYDIQPVNGLAAPDGRIFITRGFLEKYRLGQVSAEEMASVIAHELGHVALGHSRRRMIDFSVQNAVRVILIGLLAPFLRGMAVWVANSMAGLLAARLSRGDEFEADAYASALLIKAGIGTEPQKSLFRKLERLTGSGAAGAPAWLLSHPKAEARIAAIEANERKWLPA